MPLENSTFGYDNPRPYFKFVKSATFDSYRFYFQGLKNENDNDRVMFGEYVFENSDESLQYFPVQVKFAQFSFLI